MVIELKMAKMPPSEDDITIPSVVDDAMQYGRYKIMGILGDGSTGKVYRAHDPHIDRPIALKVLRRDYVSTDKYVQRFTKEAKAIGRLSHPNIVTIHDVGQDHDTIYIAMELIEGQPLNKLIKTHNFEILQVIDLGTQVATALDYAHQKGVIHRDIKPSNLIVQDDGRIKLTDFGIAHLEDTSTTMDTRTGDLLGTPAFMSPEQIESKTIDRRTDYFSLGVILYRLAAGKWPFLGKTIAAFFHAICHYQPKKPNKINPAIPQVLSDLIMKSLEKDPEQRFQTGKEMASALRSCRALVSKPDKQQPRKYLVYGFILVACLAGLGAWLTSTHFSGNSLMVPTDGPIPQKPTLAKTQAFALDQTTKKNPVVSNASPVKTVPIKDVEAKAPTKKNPAVSNPLPVKAVKTKTKADPKFHLNARLNHTRFQQGEEMVIQITPTKLCYCYIYIILEDNSIIQLLPNSLRAQNLIKAGQTLTFPDESMANGGAVLKTHLPTGKINTTEKVYIVALKKPAKLDSKNIKEGLFSLHEAKTGQFEELVAMIATIPANERTETILPYQIIK